MSFALSIRSVDEIIHYAGYLLDFSYPITIALTLFVLFFGKRVQSNAPYIVGVTLTAILSGLFIIGDLLHIAWINNFKTLLPLADYRIEWFIPAFLSFIITAIVVKRV